MKNDFSAELFDEDVHNDKAEKLVLFVEADFSFFKLKQDFK